MARGLILAAALLGAAPAWAGDADVIRAMFERRANGLYDFDVTVRSKDTGWDRYADRIEVLAPDGTVLATRVLFHPHDDEQPFTRDVAESGLICQHCGETCVPYEDLAPEVRERMGKWCDLYRRTQYHVVFSLTTHVRVFFLRVLREPIINRTHRQSAQFLPGS